MYSLPNWLAPIKVPCEVLTVGDDDDDPPPPPEEPDAVDAALAAEEAPLAREAVPLA